jgi:hypothetical protein
MREEVGRPGAGARHATQPAPGTAAGGPWAERERRLLHAHAGRRRSGGGRGGGWGLRLVAVAGCGAADHSVGLASAAKALFASCPVSLWHKSLYSKLMATLDRTTTNIDGTP